MPVRVLIVDDSSLFLEVLSSICASDPSLAVVGSARDGREAVEKVLSLAPDVVTLDVEMPVMDGLATLERIMTVRPTPVIMVSSLTRRASAATIKALQMGAVDFVTKPELSLRESYDGLRSRIVEKILAVAPGVRAAARGDSPGRRPSPTGRTPRIIVLGASTGGASALTRLLSDLPAKMRSTIIAVQHMPAVFSAAFCESLAQSLACPVSQPDDGELIREGRVYLAPGGRHCTVYGNTFRVGSGAPVNGHRPSVDVTMESVARRFGPEVLGALLTGIGKDGARGIAEIKERGGATWAQDEASCVVFGMPRAAIATGRVDEVLSLDEMAARIPVMAAG
jgi:two-component system, chemotaxis family, protein-glutamate methylesterase/glutaminase